MYICICPMSPYVCKEKYPSADLIVFMFECWRIDTFELCYWRRLFRVPWTARRSNQSIPKGNQPWVFTGRTNTKAEVPILRPPAKVCKELTHWKRPWCWERLRATGEGGSRGWDGWMASLLQWTWTLANSGRWWWTGKPGVLQSMGSQRVGHNWAAELNWTEHLGSLK